MNLTEDQKQFANRIYKSIPIYLTPEKERTLGLNTTEQVTKYIHDYKTKIVLEALKERGVEIN